MVGDPTLERRPVLLVHALEHRGDPVGALLGERDAQLREALEHSPEDELPERAPGPPHELHLGDPHRVGPVALPRRAAGVEGDRQVLLDARGPERIEERVVVAEEVPVAGRQHDAGEAGLAHPPHLADRGLDVVGLHDGDAGPAAREPAAEVGQPAVEGAGAGEAELGRRCPGTGTRRPTAARCCSGSRRRAPRRRCPRLRARRCARRSRRHRARRRARSRPGRDRCRPSPRRTARGRARRRPSGPSGGCARRATPPGRARTVRTPRGTPGRRRRGTRRREDRRDRRRRSVRGARTW